MILFNYGYEIQEGHKWGLSIYKGSRELLGDFEAP